jgi:hypothetical protein
MRYETHLDRRELNHLIDNPLDQRPDHFVSAIVDTDILCVEFRNIRGEHFFVDFSFFEPAGLLVPDFEKCRLIDYGQTVAFGEYEAGTYHVSGRYRDEVKLVPSHEHPRETPAGGK